MPNRMIELPRGRLIVEKRDDAYKYVYEEVKENHWIRRRRWEKHEKPAEGGKPHIHYYNETGLTDGFQKEFSVEYDLRKVLEEIKKDFDASIDVEAAILQAKGD